jgi:hypothetical protein
MKTLKLLAILFSLFSLTSATQTMVITFTFDIYLAEISPRNLSDEALYQELGEIIWEQAQYLASGRIYGFKFHYFSPSSWDLPRGDFTLQPQAMIARGNSQLQIRSIRRLSPAQHQVLVRYILTPAETSRYRKFQERSLVLNQSRGIMPYNDQIIFFQEALEDSFYHAIRSFAQERNRSQLEGEFVIKNNGPLLIKSGFAIQYSQIQIVVQTPTPFSV